MNDSGRQDAAAVADEVRAVRAEYADEEAEAAEMEAAQTAASLDVPCPPVNDDHDAPS